MSAIHLTQREAERAGLAKRSKYGVRTDAAGKAARTVDGIVFASLKEAQRYWELKMLEKAGEITDLILQAKFPLCVFKAEKAVRIGTYIADFHYFDGGKWHCEDVKGFRTPLYRWKKKHFEAQYNIQITEI